MNSLINLRLPSVLLSSVLILLLSCTKDKYPIDEVNMGYDEVNKSNEADIKSWKFGDNSANIAGTDITINLSYGTDITALKADVQLSIGASINPDPKNNMDYTNSVTFTVTAEDGATKDYKVLVSIENSIISWTAGWRDDDAYTANINQSTGKIDIDVNSADFDTKVNLSAGVSIDKDPNSVTDWTDEVNFKITKGLKTKTYTVKVKVNGKDIIKVTDANIKNTIKDEIAKHSNTANYNYIDVSNITIMQYLFEEICGFNGDISKWNVSNVVNMNSTFENFYSCAESKFNNDIGPWDVSNVTSMQNMFYDARAFNQDISKWDVSKVMSMQNMFDGAEAFNQDISKWDVSNVTNMDAMFAGASTFNQDISKWDVSNVTNMRFMFSGVSTFNQDISKWNVSKVTNMAAMFYKATAFNQDVGKWDVSKVTNMADMFSQASAFNQDISKWKVSKVTRMSAMFSQATAFNQDIGDWDVSEVTNMKFMFSGTVFNQDISKWKVNNVNECSNFVDTHFNNSYKPTFNNCTP